MLAAISRHLAIAGILATLLAAGDARAQTDPLPSWNDGPAKAAILDFVADVTTEGGPDFVPRPERVAAFDNDGTLWTEQPYYNQLAFALDRVRELAPAHPEWKERQPFKSVLEGDLGPALAGGHEAVLELVMATHAGMTTDELAATVAGWLATARHSKLGRPYTGLVYRPMLELLAYLRANGFKTFVVSGGGIDFMRPWTERVYGIPPEQVAGSSIKSAFEVRGGEPVIVKQPALEFVDDGPGRPSGIHRFIGRRPIAAFGNSDGDLQLLQWKTGGEGRRFGLIVHHDDAEREFAYGRASEVGRLDEALDAAPTAGWTVVSIKRDWRTIFPTSAP
jgi:hypothetical protein